MGKPSKVSGAGEDLHSAARAGDLSTVISICSSDPLAINSRDKHSRTPLHLAAWAGQTQVVSYLCKMKADVGAAAMDDMGAIHFAAQKGHLEVVRTLVSSGVSIKALTRKGMSALHYAVQGSNVELVKYLVKKGSSLSAKTKAGKTPLDLASSEEIRSVLVQPREEKAEGANPKPSSSNKMEEDSKDETVCAALHEKRDNTMEEASPEPKRARVALTHLLTTDDATENS